MKVRIPRKISLPETGLIVVWIGAVICLGIVLFRNDDLPTGFEQWQGTLAPDIAMTTMDGRQIRLGELKGKRVIVDFWATWCGPCVREIPNLVRLSKESPDDLVILGISSESAEVMKPFVAAHGIPYPVVLASGLPEPFGAVHAIPTTFFIDRKGVIHSVLVGYHDYADLRKRAK